MLIRSTKFLSDHDEDTVTFYRGARLADKAHGAVIRIAEKQSLLNAQLMPVLTDDRRQHLYADATDLFWREYRKSNKINI